MTTMILVIAPVMIWGCLLILRAVATKRTLPLGKRELRDACEALALRAACVEHERMDERLKALLDDSRRLDGTE